LAAIVAPSRPRPGDSTQRPLRLDDDDDEASLAKTNMRPELKQGEPGVAETAPNAIVPPRKQSGSQKRPSEVFPKVQSGNLPKLSRLQLELQAKSHVAETAPNPVVGRASPHAPTEPVVSAPLRRDSMVDSTVSGYRIEGVLGRGAAGIVYKAMHISSGRRAAFKVLKPEFADDPDYIRRLVEEAKALTAIRHKGIIDILDFGALPSGQPYLVMELCDGLSLEEQLKFGGPPTLVETLGLLEELFDALSAAHDRGIVHRDLKPSNLFLATYADGSRVLKVLDFGLARRAVDGKKSVRPTMPGTMVGTPDYMPPEQIKGEKMGPPSDIYAVGGIAFRLLANRLPFIGANGIAVIAKKMEEPPPHLRDVDAKLPAALDELVFRMMAVEQKARPSLKDARAAFAAYRASLRRGPVPSLLDEDPSTGPTAFHDFRSEQATNKEQLPPAPSAPVNVPPTEIALRPPFASPPTRPTDLELRAPRAGPSTAVALQALQDAAGPRWGLIIGLGILLLAVGALAGWFATRH
jgi:serine/threonine-protein kinase